MTEWTPDASEYLEGYLNQVSALARNQGDDAEEIVSGLRDHVAHEVGFTTGVPVNIDTLFDVLAAIGTPEQVASSETPLGSLSQPVAPAASAGYAAPPPLPPSSAPPPQRVIVKHRSWAGCAVASLIFVVVAIVLVSITATIAAIALPNLLRVRELARLAACVQNEKQMGLELFIYANKHEGLYPSLSNQAGRLMFSSNLYPEFLSDTSVLVCPSDKNAPTVKSDEEFVDDHAYYYLSHAITSEVEGLA